MILEYRIIGNTRWMLTYIVPACEESFDEKTLNVPHQVIIIVNSNSFTWARNHANVDIGTCRVYVQCLGTHYREHTLLTAKGLAGEHSFGTLERGKRKVMSLKQFGHGRRIVHIPCLPVIRLVLLTTAGFGLRLCLLALLWVPSLPGEGSRLCLGTVGTFGPFPFLIFTAWNI